MTEAPILIVGGGPAGASAAATLAEAGLPVLLAEQRDQLGGAIHRQPANGAGDHVWRPARHRRTWAALTARLRACAGMIEIRTQTVFLGVDGAGRFLFDDRRAGRVFASRPRAAIVAVGAIETIRPFPGWELPGVMTAGGAQVLLKETGRPPEGPILIAGSGPLLPALAAQLAKAGNPPVAVLERGRPWRPGTLARLALAGGPMGEAVAYAAALALGRVPYRCGALVTRAEPDGAGLAVGIRAGADERVLRVRHLLIHDGIEPNRAGIPLPAPEAAVPVLLAGDGREALGADAALLDGRRAALQLLARLGTGTAELAALESGLERARRVQAALAQALGSKPMVPAPETLICRCEGRSYADLQALADDASVREIRLMGRFGLGACQGRFCGPMIAALRGRPVPAASPPRWPLRPVSVAALARLSTDETE